MLWNLPLCYSSVTKGFKQGFSSTEWGPLFYTLTKLPVLVICSVQVIYSQGLFLFKWTFAPKILLLLWTPALWLSLYNHWQTSLWPQTISLWLTGTCRSIIFPFLCFAFFLVNHIGPPRPASLQVKLQEMVFWVPCQKSQVPAEVFIVWCLYHPATRVRSCVLFLPVYQPSSHCYPKLKFVYTQKNVVGSLKVF